MKELKKVNMFCSICEENHDVSLIEEERETMVKGEKINIKSYIINVINIETIIYLCLVNYGI